MRATPLGRRILTPPTSQTRTPLPTGLVLNGSTNTTMKSALAAVKGNSARMPIVVKGDSTSAGYGAAITANGTSSSVAAQVAGARPYVPYLVMASLMAADGYAALNNAIVADNGLAGQSISLPAFDARVTLGGAAAVVFDQHFGGGGIFQLSATSTTFAFTESVTTAEVVMLNNGDVTFTVDGSAASGITATTGGSVAGATVTFAGSPSWGFVKITIPLGAAGTHTLGMTSTAQSVPAAISAFNSGTKAAEIFVHGSGGATAADQASNDTTNFWQNNNLLAFQAPKLTIINVGLNNMSAGSPTTTYESNLQTMITTAKTSGDVLIVGPNAADPVGFTTLANQDLYHASAAAVAATNNVAFCDIRTALGDWATTGARTADATVHPNRGYYADIAAYIWSCIKYMREN